MKDDILREVDSCFCLQIIARAYDSDSYKMDYDSLKVWKAIPTCCCRFIVAKNQSEAFNFSY